jgi:outer membrane protein
LATALGFLLPAGAQAMSLEDALAAAYVSNPTLNAARAEMRAADEQVPQALSGWRPTVSLSGDVGVEHSEIRSATTGAEIDDTLTPRSYGVSLSQPVFDGFGTTNAVNAAENAVLAARGQLTAVEQGILLGAAQAYMDVLRALAVVDLRVNNEQVLSRQLDATRDRFEVGEITRTDVSQAESRLAGAVAGRLAAEADLQSARATFERLVGVPPESLEWPDEFEATLPTSKDAAVAEALEGQPQVIAARYAALAAQDSVGVVRAELLPSVSVQASASKAYESSTSVDRADSEAVQAVVRVPLYQSGSMWSRLREAKHTAGQRRIEVDEALQTTRENTVQAWEGLLSARAQIKSLSAQVEAAQVALEGVQREAQVGARTVLDVLDAEQELLNARVELVSARRNERVASYQLLSAMGRLTAPALSLPVTPYDPSQHYDDIRDRWFGSSEAAEKDQAGDPPRPEAKATGSGGAF